MDSVDDEHSHRCNTVTLGKKIKKTLKSAFLSKKIIKNAGKSYKKKRYPLFYLLLMYGLNR